MSIEVAAAGNLEGPCTTKARKRIAYVHRHADKVYRRFKLFPSCSHLTWIMHAGTHKSVRDDTANTNFIEPIAFFAWADEKARGASNSCFDGGGYRSRSSAPSGRSDPSLRIRIRREREIGFTVCVERDGGVVKIDYDIIICARARRLKRTNRCNDGIMLL